MRLRCILKISIWSRKFNTETCNFYEPTHFLRIFLILASSRLFSSELWKLLLHLQDHSPLLRTSELPNFSLHWTSHTSPSTALEFVRPTRSQVPPPCRARKEQESQRTDGITWPSLLILLVRASNSQRQGPTKTFCSRSFVSSLNRSFLSSLTHSPGERRRERTSQTQHRSTLVAAEEKGNRTLQHQVEQQQQEP